MKCQSCNIETKMENYNSGRKPITKSCTFDQYSWFYGHVISILYCGRSCNIKITYQTILAVTDLCIENRKYLRFATGFLTLEGNLLWVNRFFSFRFASVKHKHKKWDVGTFCFGGSYLICCSGKIFCEFVIKSRRCEPIEKPRFFPFSVSSHPFSW